ncbi:MAG: HNH endonuclease [Planctomycetales bacterium]|nr:HNH endonuclease [Planctomycetales bacterium]
MRPVNRGASPQDDDFDDYRDAFPELASRLGFYCSYCERRIATNLAVEHIQPKKLPQYEHLEGRWENFLLGCVNCNSTKGKKDVVLDSFLLPDRDNTAFAYAYREDGDIEVNPVLPEESAALAASTLELVGLDKPISEVEDENGQIVAIDRVAQRMEAWLIAQDSKLDLEDQPTDGMRRQVARTALAQGHFSIWMTVFADNPKMRRLLVREFPGTATECFDEVTLTPVTPRPENGLEAAGKV